MAPLGAKSASPYLDLRGAKLRGRAKMVFSVAISEIRWAESVPSETVLALVIQNGPTGAKSALKKLGPIWLLGPIQLFPFYSVCFYSASKISLNTVAPCTDNRLVA